METINKIPSRIIEIETSIKLLEYLKMDMHDLIKLDFVLTDKNCIKHL